MNGIENLYQIIPLKPLRHTPGVWFDLIPEEVISKINAVDRVIHKHGAVSPGPVGSIERPWYVHLHQEDHLLVMHGMRHIDFYSQKHGRIETVNASPLRLEKDGQVIHEGPYILKWFTNVFHRIISDAEIGSASLNFAVRHDGFDIRTNFSIYDLNVETGECVVIREGFLDQP